MSEQTQIQTYEIGDKVKVAPLQWGQACYFYGRVTDLIINWPDWYEVEFADEHGTHRFTVHAGEIEPMPQTYGSSVCKHEWASYAGVMESFEYCTKCDEKRQ